MSVWKALFQTWTLLSLHESRQRVGGTSWTSQCKYNTAWSIFFKIFIKLYPITQISVCSLEKIRRNNSVVYCKSTSTKIQFIIIIITIIIISFIYDDYRRFWAYSSPSVSLYKNIFQLFETGGMLNWILLVFCMQLIEKRTKIISSHKSLTRFETLQILW